MAVIAKRRNGYTHDVDIDGRHALVADEPPEKGGNDEGPSPTRILAAALASCTAITAEMYADRKGWDVGQLRVEVETTFDGPVPVHFEVTLHCEGAELDDEQRERLRVIAGKCPVHKALASETAVTIVDSVAAG